MECNLFGVHTLSFGDHDYLPDLQCSLDTGMTFAVEGTKFDIMKVHLPDPFLDESPADFAH